MRYAALLLAVTVLRAQPSQPVFATYLGGGGFEVAGSVATDSQGNIYIAGRTDSPDFPVKNAIQPEPKSYSQIFIAKFDPAGNLLYSTYFGGSANDLATAIATDPAGNVYVTGALQSTDFPVAKAFQAKNAGGVDAFVLKLDPSGNVLYATYLGGTQNDFGMAITADAAGNAYVTGRTESADFPVTGGAFQTQPAQYISGITSITAYATKLDASGNLVYSTFLGGSNGDVGWAIAVDALEQAHVAGQTSSLDFPTTPNAIEPAAGRSGGSRAFLTKLTGDGSGLVYSTYLGGPLTDSARALAIDSSGNAYITGQTTDARLPIVNGAQSYLGGDVYLVSTDGGDTFTPRRQGLAAAEVTAILFDPSTPLLVYAGTLQGIFRSIDGGNTWSPSGLDDLWIEQIVADPARPGTLFAGTWYGGGLYRSTDGGDTWTNLAGPADLQPIVFQAMAVDPAAGVVYVEAGSAGEGLGINQPLYRVTEDGAQWTLIGNGLPTAPVSLAVRADSTLFAGTPSFTWVNLFVAGELHFPGTVYWRVAGGWQSSSTLDDGQIGALAFNGNTLYAAGQNFYQSTDGGQTWTTTAFAGYSIATAMAVDPHNPAAIYVLRAGLLRSADGGQTFETVSSQPFTAMAVNPQDSSVHVGTTASADAYVAEFDPTGALIYSTFIGTPAAERGDAIALDASGRIYIAGFRSPGSLDVEGDGTTFVARADDPGDSVTIGASTIAVLLDMPTRGITIGPDGGIIVVMTATQAGLPVQNATQSNLNGASDVYLVKWMP